MIEEGGENILPKEVKITDITKNIVNTFIDGIKRINEFKENFAEIWNEENVVYNLSQGKNIMEVKTRQDGNTIYKGQYQRKFDNNKNNIPTYLPNGYGIFYEKDKKKYYKIEEGRNKDIKKITKIQYDNKGKKIEEGEYSTNQARNGVIMIYKKNNKDDVKYFLDKFKGKEEIKNENEHNKEVEVETENIEESIDEKNNINNTSNEEQTPIIEGNFSYGWKKGYIKEKYNDLLLEYICNNNQEQIVRVTKYPDDVDKKNIYFLLDKNFVKQVYELCNNEEVYEDDNNVLGNIKEDNRDILKERLYNYYTQLNDNDNIVVGNNNNINNNDNIVCKNYNYNNNDYYYLIINSQKNEALYGTLNKIINDAATSYEQQKNEYKKTAEKIKKAAQKIENTDISAKEYNQDDLRKKYIEQQKKLLLLESKKNNQNIDNDNEDNKDFLSNALEKTFGFFSDLFSGEYDIIDKTIDFCDNLLKNCKCNQEVEKDKNTEIPINVNNNNNLQYRTKEQNNEKSDIDNNESKINLNIETYEQQKTNSIH